MLVPDPVATDPTDLDTAVRAGAFDALRMAIRAMTPGQVIATVVASGLRGRGGAGFPTGTKWRTAASADGSTRYVVANGYGADPAVQTDRTLMELAPYALIEGIALASYAVGAREAFVAVRAEATETIRRLEVAIAAAEEAGLLGADVLESGWDLDDRGPAGPGRLHARRGDGPAQGDRGQARPARAATAASGRAGLFGRPTVVDNVQTLASVPWIVSHGAEAFAAIGSKAAPGTILVQVRGSGRRRDRRGPARDAAPGRDRAPAAGGKPGRRPRARSRRSSSAARRAASCRRTCSTRPTTTTALRAVDAHIGSGSVVVADERACIVDLARLLTRFCADQACGKTIPCRIGTRRLSEMADRIALGTPRPTDAGLAADLAADIVGSALCDHERLATLPLTSAMRYFRPELDDHLLRSTCPAGVCQPIGLAAAGADRGA